MCGIAGIFHTEPGRMADEAALVAMRDTMVHRGPDDAGLHLDGPVGLAQRRLSIIDLSGGHQPMASADGAAHITYNGEIYNFKDIKRHLEGRGRRFRTSCDTEVLLELIQEEGAAGLQRLNGMFAFAYWDARARRLFAARDRLGIKPFYYYWDGRTFLFSSEIKALLAHPDARAELDEGALREYFAFGELFRPETILRHVYKLMPGHHLSFDGREIRTERYWSLDQARDDSPLSEDQALARVDELLYAAIERRMISDVPLGVFLSGGLDSSLIAAYMTRIAGGAIQTYSVGYPEEGGNEFEYSELMAEHLKSDHTKLLLKSGDYFGLLDRLIWHFDMPLKNLSSPSLFSIADATKGKATVVLMGQGADELFAGYPRVWTARAQFQLNALARRALPGPIRRGVAAMAPRLSNHKIATKLLARLDLPDDRVAAGYSQNVVDALLERCFSPRVVGLGGGAVADPTARYFRESALTDPINRMLYADTHTYLTNLINTQDKMTMAASIEARVPFLDHELVEFAFTLPSRLKLKGRTGKYLLKRLAERHVPRRIIYRKKAGFPTPIRRWLQSDEARLLIDTVYDARTRARGLFDHAFLERHLEDVRAGRLGSGPDAMYLLWKVATFERWARIFLDGEGVVAA
jgi:asparagine synthase (glutamine-hydrolysing)